MVLTEEPKRQVHIWRGFGALDSLELYAFSLDYDSPMSNNFDWLEETDVATIKHAEGIAATLDKERLERHRNSELMPLQGVWSVVVTDLSSAGETSTLRFVRGPLWED